MTRGSPRLGRYAMGRRASSKRQEAGTHHPWAPKRTPVSGPASATAAEPPDHERAGGARPHARSAATRAAARATSGGGMVWRRRTRRSRRCSGRRAARARACGCSLDRQHVVVNAMRDEDRGRPTCTAGAASPGEKATTCVKRSPLPIPSDSASGPSFSRGALAGATAARTPFSTAHNVPARRRTPSRSEPDPSQAMHFVRAGISTYSSRRCAEFAPRSGWYVGLNRCAGLRKSACGLRPAASSV
jgi:hypothetical protein